VQLVFSPASESVLSLGRTTVTYSATDASGNSTTGSFIVAVVDTSGPAISGAPSYITVNPTSAAGAVVTYSANAVDSVDGTVPVVLSPTSGSTFALGTSTVTYSAVDKAGNRTTGTFLVTVTTGVRSPCATPT
jgi:hypothetical protein